MEQSISISRRCSLKKRIVIIVVLALLIGTGLFVYLGQQKARQGELFYSGTIEATQSHLAFQAGGRVLSVAVKEGEAVAKDQLLAELDPAEFRSRLEQAKANLEKSMKNREQAEALLRVFEQTLPAEQARAEAGVRALASQVDELKAGIRPQEIARANQATQSAASVMEDAKKNAERYESLFRKGTVSEKERDAVRLRYPLPTLSRYLALFSMYHERAKKPLDTTTWSWLCSIIDPTAFPGGPSVYGNWDAGGLRLRRYLPGLASATGRLRSSR